MLVVPLVIRPVTRPRTPGNFICALWKTLQQCQSRAGVSDSLRAILTEFCRISATGVARPDRSQALLIDRLGLKLPDRLRLPQTVQM